jgi:hypothetical protein
MATPSWRVGAFADRFPQEARGIGVSHAVEAAANDMLYAAAGVVRPGAIGDAAYGCPSMATPCDGPSPGCCSASACGRTSVDTCCDRGTCSGNIERGSDFEDLYPELDRRLDAQHALAAAIRDINADPDVADVASAIEEAMVLSEDELLALYAPQVPAKPLPDGSPAPARCPICGAAVCPTCGCTCECCDAAFELDSEETPAAPAE